MMAAGALGVAGCGAGSGDEPTGTGTGGTVSVDDDQNRFPRSSSVGGGSDPDPPAIAPAVRRAAEAAGCQVRGFGSDGRDHVETDPDYTTSLPPVSGPHNIAWADFGVYDRPLPFQFQVHSLEHGAVIVHLGSQVPQAARDQVVELWRESPPYMIVTPETFAEFPKRALVVTSWQRWMVCRGGVTPKVLEAVRAYRDTYRGTGPESVTALNVPRDATNDPDFVRPAIPDEGAILGSDQG
jgi:hypothetical protein